MGNRTLNWQKSVHGSISAKGIFAAQKGSVGDPSPLGMKLHFFIMNSMTIFVFDFCLYVFFKGGGYAANGLMIIQSV